MRSSPSLKACRKFAEIISACLLVAILLTAAGGRTGEARGQSSAYTGISVEASSQIFATMCALSAAGFAVDEQALAGMPERLSLQAELLKMQGPATEAVRDFYRQHALGDPGETLSQYMAFALVTGEPPRFQFLVDLDLLPPDVLPIQGFQEILGNFYREAHLDSRWPGIEPEYDSALNSYQSPVRHIVTLSNAYAREIMKPSYGRTFTVYVEPLVGNVATFRNTGDRYAIVVGKDPQTSVENIQHSYLHFLLDPLPLQYRLNVEKKAALLDIAARAPRLPVEYQDDFVAFTDECLIRAAELRVRRLPPDQLEAALQEDDQSGFILVRPLVGQLQKYEKSEVPLPDYFPDMIAGVDVEAEQKRLKNVVFAAAQTGNAATLNESSKSHAPSEVDQLLAEGDRDIAARDPAGAAAAFQKVLDRVPNQPRAMYGLAVASVLSGQADRAKELFEKLVSGAASAAPGSDHGANAASPDPSILAWSHVYLGRMHDIEGDRDLAVGEYRAALGIEGAPESARAAAQNGVNAPYQPPSHPQVRATPQP